MTLALLAPITAGALAGLAVAVPLGPIGLLLLDVGARRGRALAIFAAAGIAGTDLLYAGLAAWAGPAAVAHLDRWSVPLGLASSALLTLMAVAALRPARAPSPEPTAPADAGAGPLAVCAMFFGLTLVNPATLAAFAAVVTGMPVLEGPADRLAFTAAAGTASFAWQSGLALVSAWIGARASPRLFRWSRTGGAVLMFLLAAAAAIRTVR